MPAVAEQVQAELQDYLNVKGVNALFVAIVEGLLIEKPTNPIAFIIEFLCKSYPDLAVQARIPELLQAQRADMDKQAAEARAAASVEEDDDMDDDEEAKLVLNGSRRGGVTSGGLSAEALSSGPPKNEEQKGRVLDMMAQNGFLRQLDEELQSELVSALVPVECAAGDVVAKQGDGAEEADKFFIIEEGTVEVRQLRSGVAAGGGAAGMGELAKELSAGDSFGELALLHGAARESSFVCKTPSTLWVLSRDAYRLTIMRATDARRARYKDFLRGVTCLKGVSDYDILALADAAEEVDFHQVGDLAYAQGDPESHRLSVVLKGEASCFLTDAGGQEREVARLKSGDHFIEDPANPTETTSVRAVGPGRRALVLLRVEADVFLRVAGSMLNVQGTQPFDGLAGAVQLTASPTPQISAAQEASWQERES
jgi:cAMP-dependent protein kinase regulator